MISKESSPITPRDSTGFKVGNTVWSSCTRQGYRRSTIVSADLGSDSYLVGDECGQERVRRDDIRPFYDSGPEFTCDDNTSLVHLDDANILDNLCRRFHRDEIYTYTANVLLAVNPYKDMEDLYSTARMREYRGRIGGLRPPHPYEIADKAFRHLMQTGRSQALVISGESGAGKTETAKITMRYLAAVSRTDAEQSGQVQEKILNANPILESFGNASTVRNRNSSRFGKYNEMYFNQVGSLVGAGIKTFLLEASRVVSLAGMEENYHVFYEMLAGLEGDRLDELMLVPTARYRLLRSATARAGGDADAPTDAELERRARKFSELRQALSVVGIGEQDEADIWDAVAALIHLGEVDFAAPGSSDEEDFTPITTQCSVEASPTNSRAPTTILTGMMSPGGGNGNQDDSPVSVQNRDNLGQAADLLGLSIWSLQELLQRRKMRVKGQDFDCLRTKAQAQQTLHSLIKVLYQRLFDKIVDFINRSSSTPAAAGAARAAGSLPRDHEISGCRHIGTLDIYGFECLEANGFEQLCINLANERLQQFFIEEVLQAEQRMYEDERLNIPPLKLPDSQPVVNRIQEIMAVLDEHSLRAQRGLGRNDPDQRFCEHVHRQNQDNSGLVMPLRLRANRSGNGLGMNDGFQIRHYAGDVPYSTRGWIEKNNDARMPEVEALLADSSKQLVQDMAGSADVVAGERVHSVTKRYLGNLDSLLQTLKRCSVHYIRCFNPNKNQQPGVFDKKYVLDQVVHCGTVELVKIMHNGFPHRVALQELRNRFTGLLPQDMVENYSPAHFVLAIMLAFEIEEGQWTLGLTRLFLKAGQLRVLENLRDAGSTASKEMIWKIRALFARKKVRAACAAISFLRWLPGHVKQSRKARFTTKLNRVVFVFVRLHRWLGKARAKLHGNKPTQRMTHLDVAQHALGLTYRLPIAGMNQGLPHTGRQQLFVALNGYDRAEVPSPLDDAARRSWHGRLAESVLFYDGHSTLISARLSPTAFQRQPGQQSLGRSLSDVRRVDVFDSGLAVSIPTTLPVPSRSTSGSHCADESASGSRSARRRVDCMCQHKKDPQIFAACNGNGQGMVWRWLGTQRRDTQKAALQPLGRFQIPATLAVLQMCFVSQVPSSIDTRNGFVIALLCAERDRHWMQLLVISVYPALGGYNIEIQQVIGLDSPPCAAEEGVHVSFLTTSHSDRIIVVGGRCLLQFYAFKDVAGGRPQLVLIEDCAQTFQDIGRRHMVSCLGPPPCSQTVFDWVVVGDSKGKLYGFGFDVKPGGKIQMNPHTAGRYRTNTHDEQVPITDLVATYSSCAEAPQQTTREIAGSMFYGDVLQSRTVDKGFYSLGENGRLLSWNHNERTGWQSSEEINVGNTAREDAGPGSHFVAGHASRLVPQVIILVDGTRKLLFCYDRDKRSADAACSYA